MRSIPKHLLEHPDWYQVEELVMEFINPLLDLTSIDNSQPAEHVKAEVIARKLSYDALIQFSRSSGIIRSDKLIENKPNIFR